MVVSERISVDLCIIGAGAAGLSLVTAAAGLGARVAIAERGEFGGRRLHAELPRRTFGALARECPDLAPAEVARRLEAAVTALAPNDSAARLAALGTRVLTGEARFADERTLHVGDVAVGARRFVVAAGSRPRIPPGLAGIPVLTEDRFFDPEMAPGRIVVLGSGSAACEIALAYRRHGAEVLIVGTGPLLPEHDPEVAAVAVRALEGAGVSILRDATVAGAERRESGLVLDLIHADGMRERIEGAHLVAAAWREAQLEGLGLDAAGIAFDERGIRVDSRLLTTNRRVFAIGSCTGHGGGSGSARQASLVLRAALFGVPIRYRPELAVRHTATAPALASVGLDEAAATAAHGTIRILRAPLAENPRAVAEERRGGHVKAITDRRGRLLGCSIAGAEAGEMIAPFALALAKGLKVTDIAELSLPAGTYGEASQRAALEFLRPQAQNPWLKRLMAALRRLT